MGVSEDALSCPGILRRPHPLQICCHDALDLRIQACMHEWAHAPACRLVSGAWCVRSRAGRSGIWLHEWVANACYAVMDCAEIDK